MVTGASAEADCGMESRGHLSPSAQLSSAFCQPDRVVNPVNQATAADFQPGTCAVISAIYNSGH